MESGAKVTGNLVQALVAWPWWQVKGSSEETWLPESNTLSECFNNVDVGVSLWLIEPRDKYPHREFASSYPALYVSAFHTNFSCAFTFIE